MRILLSFGFVAAVSATAGAQLGTSDFSLATEDTTSIEIAPLLATPQSSATVERNRRDRRLPLDANPYAIAGYDASLGTRELGDLGPALDLEGNPYARLGVARPHVAGNPYYVTSLDDPRDRAPDTGRPVVFETNPYVY